MGTIATQIGDTADRRQMADGGSSFLLLLLLFLFPLQDIVSSLLFIELLLMLLTHELNLGFNRFRFTMESFHFHPPERTKRPTTDKDDKQNSPSYGSASFSATSKFQLPSRGTPRKRPPSLWSFLSPPSPTGSPFPNDHCPPSFSQHNTEDRTAYEGTR